MNISRSLGTGQKSHGTVIYNMKSFTRHMTPKKITACVLDWSGTVCDKYTIAPTITFQKTFAEHGIRVTMDQCREPMGMRKDLHIREMLFKDGDIQQQWSLRYKRRPNDDDVESLYTTFIPLQMLCLKEHGKLIPGTLETFRELQGNQGVKMGSTTGFSRQMIDILNHEAFLQGVVLDSTVGGDEVEHGCRPSPHMLFQNLDNMNIDDIHTVVKVDDTVGGIQEGLNAGCWTVGVSRYSNYMNIDSDAHEESLSEAEIKERNDISRQKLLNAGANYVVDSIADLPEIIKKINTRLFHNETPSM